MQRDRQREMQRRRRGFDMLAAHTINLRDPETRRFFDHLSARRWMERSGDEPNLYEEEDDPHLRGRKRIIDRNLSTSSSEGEPHIFGSQGTISIHNDLNLPPPPPVPQDPINYP